MWWEVITDALLDTLKLFPFLFLLYILIEHPNRKAERRAERQVCAACGRGVGIGADVRVFGDGGKALATSSRNARNVACRVYCDERRGVYRVVAFGSGLVE